MRVVGTFAADESAAAKRYACPKTSVFGRLALRARANALALNIFSEVMRARPARCASVRGRAGRATRPLFARLALDIRRHSQAHTEHRTNPQDMPG